MVAAAFLLVASSAVAQPAATIQAWVGMWNSYDLNLVDSLFVSDSTVTYFSSERVGRIHGIDGLRAHHIGFGFVPGGAQSDTRLWLEDQHAVVNGSTITVTATWLFQRGTDEAQRGPVTFVLVARDGQFRIQHAHFSNDP